VSTQLALLVAYSVLLIGLGLWIGRRVSASGDFFVAGRTLGPGLVFSTMLAANIGAGSTVGATGLAYRDGVAAWWWVGSAGIGSVLLALWVGPAVRRLAERHDLHTVGDFLAMRYGPDVRTIVSVLLWFGSLAILAGQLIAIAWVLNVVTALPKYAGCIIGGLVITIYFAAGGLLTSAWVNLVQLVVKLTGFALAVPIALYAIGGPGALSGLQIAGGSYWNPWHSGASGVLYLALLGPSFVVSPGLLQKVYGARDDRAVRLGVGLNALGLLVYAAVPVLLGMIARVRFPSLPNHELALPMVLMHGVPPLVGALGLAAVFSAEISAADAVLFMLTTSLAQDLYKRAVEPQATDRRMLVVVRIAAVVSGAAGVALAIVSPTVIDALKVFYALLTVSLFVPVLAGVWSTRAGRPEALSAIVSGVSVMVVVRLWAGAAGFRGITPDLAGLLAAIIAFAFVFTWRR
jgi:solute:Na+ symporter, SSS family